MKPSQLFVLDKTAISPFQGTFSLIIEAWHDLTLEGVRQGNLLSLSLL